MCHKTALREMSSKNCVQRKRFIIYKIVAGYMFNYFFLNLLYVSIDILKPVICRCINLLFGFNVPVSIRILKTYFSLSFL